MLKKIGSALVVVSASAILLGGCGGGGDETQELSKAEFIKQADAICAKTDKAQEAELTAYLKENPKAESSQAGQEKMVTDAGLPPLQEEIGELAELEPPSSDAQKVEAIVKDLEEALKKSEDTPGLLVRGPDPFAEVGKLATAYGFKECNQPI